MKSRTPFGVAAHTLSRALCALVSLILVLSAAPTASAQDTFSSRGFVLNGIDRYYCQGYRVECDYNSGDRMRSRNVVDPPASKLGRDPFLFGQFAEAEDAKDGFDEDAEAKLKNMLNAQNPIRKEKTGQTKARTRQLTGKERMRTPGRATEKKHRAYKVPGYTEALPTFSMSSLEGGELPNFESVGSRVEIKESEDGIDPPHLSSSSTAPILQGATFGTIGPQGTETDYSIKDEFFCDPQLKAVRIIFQSDLITPARVRSATRHVHVPRPFTIVSVPKCWLPEKKNSLSDVLFKIESARDKSTADLLRYQIKFPRGSHKWKQKQPPQVLVFEERPRQEALSALYQEAARLESDPAKKAMYQGASALNRADWKAAWRHFEEAHEAAPSDYKLAEQIIGLYKSVTDDGFEYREIEAYIWYTRYLRYEPDWDKFAIAWGSRAAIQNRWAEENEAKNQRMKNSFWEAKRMPLKVYFAGQSTADFDARLVSYFRDMMAEWVVSTGGKIDYVETKNITDADIICKWDHKEDTFGEGFDKTRLPSPQQKTWPLATTSFWHTKADGKEVLNHAEIVVYARSTGDGRRLMEDDEFRNVYLHEIGHALGIHRHLDASSRNVMYYCASSWDPNLDLTPEDTDMIGRLYQKHPVNASAVEKFIGLQAKCEALTAPGSDNTANDNTGSAPLAVPLAADNGLEICDHGAALGMPNPHTLAVRTRAVTSAAP